MCINLKNFYLTANLEYFEYMKIPLNLFPQWIIDQYDLTKHAVDGMVHIEMRKAVWGLPQAGVLANKNYGRNLNHTDIVNTRILQAFGTTRPDQ